MSTRRYPKWGSLERMAVQLLIVAKDSFTAAALQRDLTKAGWHVSLSSDESARPQFADDPSDAVLVLTDDSDALTFRDDLVVGDLVLEPGPMKVTRAGRPISLTLREFELLEFLMRNAGMVMSRDAILDSVWGMDYAGVSNVVDVYVGYLRRKIDKPFGTQLIRSVRGVGYTLVSEPARTVVIDDPSVLGA